MEVMGLMLGEFVDEYTVRVVDVFALPQSGTGVSVEAVDHVFQSNMMDMLKQTGSIMRNSWIVPEAIGVPSQKENISGGSHSQAFYFPLNSSEHKKDDKGVTYTDGAAQGVTVRRSLGGSSDIEERLGVTATTAISESLVIEKVPESANKEGSISVEQVGTLKTSGSLAAGSNLSIRVFDKKEGKRYDTCLLGGSFKRMCCKWHCCGWKYIYDKRNRSCMYQRDSNSLD